MKYTAEEMDHILHCQRDISYFTDHHGIGCYIDLHQYTCRSPMQDHGCLTTEEIFGHILHQVTFCSYKSIAIICKNHQQALELMQIVVDNHEKLPENMRSVIVRRYKKCVWFDNGSRVMIVHDQSKLQGLALTSVAFTSDVNNEAGSIAMVGLR